jgi:transcriptional regulator with XRE-family HTH domain
MGRRRLSDSDLSFREEVAEKFDRARKLRGLNQSSAAKELGVTRQAFSQYLLRKATPQAAILARACTRWSLSLRYRGKEFARAAFGQEDAKNSPEQPSLQMDLFDRPQRVENDQLVVTLDRSEKATLLVTITMKNATLPTRSRRAAALTR